MSEQEKAAISICSRVWHEVVVVATWRKGWPRAVPWPEALQPIHTSWETIIWFGLNSSMALSTVENQSPQNKFWS